MATNNVRLRYFSGGLPPNIQAAYDDAIRRLMDNGVQGVPMMDRPPAPPTSLPAAGMLSRAEAATRPTPQTFDATDPKQTWLGRNVQAFGDFLGSILAPGYTQTIRAQREGTAENALLDQMLADRAQRYQAGEENLIGLRMGNELQQTGAERMEQAAANPQLQATLGGAGLIPPAGLEGQLTARGQDINARGQDLSAAVGMLGHLTGLAGQEMYTGAMREQGAASRNHQLELYRAQAKAGLLGSGASPEHADALIDATLGHRDPKDPVVLEAYGDFMQRLGAAAQQAQGQELLSLRMQALEFLSGANPETLEAVLKDGGLMESFKMLGINDPASIADALAGVGEKDDKSPGFFKRFGRATGDLAIGLGLQEPGSELRPVPPRYEFGDSNFSYGFTPGVPLPFLMYEPGFYAQPPSDRVPKRGVASKRREE